MRKRIVELEASLTRERARNDKLVAATEQREQAWEKATAKLTELHKLQNEHAAIHWGELESQLRAEVAATTADCEARIAKYQRDYEFMQAVAAKGGAPVITQNVRRGSCVRRNMRQRKMAAIQIQARWRGAAQRKRLELLRDAVTKVQSSLRRLNARRQLRQIIRLAQEARYRSAVYRNTNSGW